MEYKIQAIMDKIPLLKQIWKGILKMFFVLFFPQEARYF